MSLSRPLLPPLYAPSRREQPLGAAPESGQGLDHDERSNGASEADSDSLSEVESDISDGGDSSSIDDGSDGIDLYGSSEDESILRDDSSEHAESEDGASVDDSHGDCSEEEEHNGRYHNEEGNGYGDVHRDLCDVAGFHLDEDIRIPPQRSKRHKMIIVALSAALLLLLINFGYGLFRLSRLNDAGPPPNANDDDRKSRSEPRAEAKGNADDQLSSDDAPQTESRHPQPTTTDADNDKEYQLPRHPARIYTHASLSSKNYRAGGVLSDEMLRRYEEDGAIVVRNLVSPKLLDRLDAASAMLIEGQDETGKKKRRGKQFHMVKNGAIFLGVPKPREGSCGADGANEDGTCQANPKTDGSDDVDDDDVILSSFRDLAMYSKIPRVAASLLRLDELRAGGEQNLQLSRQQKMMQQQEAEGDGDDSVNLRICRDIFLTKDDDPYACGWHVDDTGFWPSIASDPGVNAWVALDDMPFPQSGIRLSTNANATTSSSSEGESTDERVGPVATFALSLGSHRAPWRHQAYEVTGSTHTMPEEGFLSAMDLLQRRSGSGTCNIETSAPDLYEKLERNKVIYDLKRGDVIFHDRWLFHRTVTTGEYDEMVNGSGGERQPTSQGDKIFRRYSVRYSPGSAVVPPGYGVELSVLHDEDNANRTLDEIVERSGPWYPKVWPHVLKSKPVREPSKSEGSLEEIEGIAELVHDKMPRAEELQRERKKEIQRLLSIHGGQ